MQIIFLRVQFLTFSLNGIFFVCENYDKPLRKHNLSFVQNEQMSIGEDAIIYNVSSPTLPLAHRRAGYCPPLISGQRDI